MSNMVITYPKKRKTKGKSSKATTPEPEEIASEQRPKCVFCDSNEENELEFGKIITDEQSGLTVHYYCMLFASGLCQRGKSDQDGILGFLPKDIRKEVKRGSRLRCTYCRGKGATIGCVIRACRKAFHLTCGKKAGSLHQFFDTYRSYCHDHRLKQTVPYSDRLAFFGTANSVCSICLNAVEARTSNETLRAPCCRNSWFHKQCIQGYASSAGLHFFKCPLCNNKDKFQAEMLTYGICIPDQDAAWEQEPGAYDELLQRYNNCDAPLCSCPHGRSYNRPDSKWELLRCDWCGSSASHKDCGGLRRVRRVLCCGLCAEIDKRSADTERRSGPQSGTKRTPSSDSQQPSRRRKRHRGSATASTSASTTIQDSSSDEDEEVDVVGLDPEDLITPGPSSSSFFPTASTAQSGQSMHGRRRRGVRQAALQAVPTSTPSPSSLQPSPGTSTAVSETESRAQQPSTSRVRDLSNYTVMTHPYSYGEETTFYCPCQQSETGPKKDVCIIGRRNEDAERKTLTIYYSGHKFTINKHKNTHDPDLTLNVACQDCSKHATHTMSWQSQREAAGDESSSDEGPPRLVPMLDYHVTAEVAEPGTDTNSDVRVMWRLYESDNEATNSTSDIPDILTDLPSMRITRSASASMASSSDATEAAAVGTADTSHSQPGTSNSNAASASGSAPTEAAGDATQPTADPSSSGSAPDFSSSSPSRPGSTPSRSGNLHHDSSPQTSSQRLTRSNARGTSKTGPTTFGLSPVLEDEPPAQPSTSSGRSSPSRKRPESVISVSSSDSDVEIEHVAGLPNSYVRLRHWRSVNHTCSNPQHQPWRSYMAEAAVNTNLPPQPERGGDWERVYLPASVRARLAEGVVPVQLCEKRKRTINALYTRRLRSSTPLVISSDTDGEVEALD